MKYRVYVWVGILALVFLFLPSLVFKIWDYLVGAPWQAKSWLFYIIFALMLFFLMRWRWHLRLNKSLTSKEDSREERSLLFLAKERLVKGEISLEEFREIRRELD